MISFKTGDKLLFSGKGFISWVIKWITDSDISHIGTIENRNGIIYLWESTTLSNTKDIYLNKKISGVQCVYLAERLAETDDEVYVRRLQTSLYSHAERYGRKFLHDSHGKPYENNYWELFKSAIDRVFRPNKENFSSIFCSELTAEYDKRCNIIPEGIPSNEFTPADYDDDRLIDRISIVPYLPRERIK